MRIVIDIADALLADAKRLAADRGMTLSALIEEGLRRVALPSEGALSKFTLRRASFKGRGLQPNVQGALWQRLLELAYERRSSRTR
jgi:hypothetical protein